MHSPIAVVTAIYSFVGLCLNSLVLYLVLSRGRRTYHILFAGFILICLIWDLGVFLEMIRNDHLGELAVYGYIISLPCMFMPALMLHFAVSYSGRRSRWVVALSWGMSVVYLSCVALGIAQKIEGTYTYPWGNIHKLVLVSGLDYMLFPLWYGGLWLACWILYRHWVEAPAGLQRRHAAYILAGFVIISLAPVKIAVILGIDAPLLLPLGMALTDVCSALICAAIIKDRLLDITVIVKKGVIFSALAAGVIFVFSLSEHILATYFGERLGEDSQIMHLVSVGVVIAASMPVKHRLERAIDAIFARRMVNL